VVTVIESVDFDWLSGRILRPSRSAEPHGALRPADDPRRLFRPLALDLCPRCRGRGTVGGYDSDDEWEDDAWICVDCGKYGSLAQDTPIVDWPPVPDLLSLDPEGIVRAEEAARTSVARLAPWGVPRTERVVWRVGGPLHAPMRATMPHPHAEVLRRLLFQEWRAAVSAAATTDYVLELDLAGRFAARAAWHLRLDRAWRRAAELDLVVPSSTHRPEVAGRGMAGLANPFAPLLEVWAAGYAFADIAGDAIRLIAPAAATGGS
jgi:hypothetical protein